MKKEELKQQANDITKRIIEEANKLQQEHIWKQSIKYPSIIKKLLEQNIKEEELFDLLYSRYEYLTDCGFSLKNFIFNKLYNNDTLKYIKTRRHLNRQRKYEEEKKDDK